MKRNTTQEESLRIIRNARKVTDCVLSLTHNQADYITLLLTVLGNGVAAFCQEESDEVFEAKLAAVHQIIDDISRNARERILEHALEDAVEETMH